MALPPLSRKVRGTERDKMRAEAKELYKSTSVRAIARKLGRSYGFVYNLLEEAEVEFRPRGGNRPRPVAERKAAAREDAELAQLRAADRERVKAQVVGLHKGGANRARIAQEVGISWSKVNSILREREREKEQEQ